MNHENKDLLLQLLNKHNSLGMSEQIDYAKFYLYSLITHSTAIEGSTVTEVEAQLLFDEGITSSKRSIIEQNMNLDLKAAYDYGYEWIKRHEDITVSSLINLSAKVMARTGSVYNSIAGSFDASKGELRKLNVTAGAGGRSYMNYLKVPQKLETFCQELNIRRKAINPADICAIYDLSFWAHFELVTIHPWADGNGRTCRLLMNLLQMEFDILPTKVLKQDKADYIQALIDTREKDDINIFLDCMASLHIAHLQHDIEQYELSMQDEVDRKSGQKTHKVDRKSGQKKDEAIVSLISYNPQITTSQMADSLGINRSALSKHLKRMQSENVIRRIGPDKGGHWEVIDKN
ncbi:MAG: Fic family protein [Bacteroidales bacterium]|nr:Fic family protein [Bacteroidales bacterium]